jgi:CDP-4-dehydro-6-deoxyglucose reductase
MARLLTVSRAARLVGVARGALQKQIKDGELPTFEGMIQPGDLLRLYPQTHIDDDSAIERARQIRESAFSKRLRERILPDAETLSARLAEFGRELADARAELGRYRSVVEKLQQRLRDLEHGSEGTPAAIPPLMQWLQAQLAQDLHEGEQSRELDIRDSFLRIMAAHVHILPSQHEFFVEGNDTLLDAALRSGLALEYGCSGGNCGQCKARVLSGQTKKVRNHDYVLTEAEKAAHTVLLCSYTAVTDLTVEAKEAGGTRDIPRQQIAARVHSVERLNDEIVLLHLQTPRTQRLRFFAGQSVTLGVNGVSLEQPIASCPCDDRNLQFHLRCTPGEPFARYVSAQLRMSDTVTVDGPRGEFVLDEDSPRPLIFVAYDTGFAPIKSLIEHAMALDVAETLSLYWCSTTDGGRYLQNLCRSWTDALDNFRYAPLTGEPDNPYLLNRLAAEHPDLADYDCYVAGPETFVAAAEMHLLEHGLPRGQLRSLPLD